MTSIFHPGKEKLTDLLTNLGWLNYYRFLTYSLKNRNRSQILKDILTPNRKGPENISLPPTYLRWLVIHQWDPELFIESGRLQTRKLIEPLLEKNSFAITSLNTVLDFGCGCGRILRHWNHLSGVDLWGCDYNRMLVRWCQKHLHHARFVVNGLHPPLSFEKEKFELILARSVFTHLPETMQHSWLKELNRVLKPAGHFLLTVAGDYYKERMTAPERKSYEAGNLVVREATQAGMNTCAVFHPREYMPRLLNENGFKIVDMVPGATVHTAWQDTYLAAKV